MTPLLVLMLVAATGEDAPALYDHLLKTPESAKDHELTEYRLAVALQNLGLRIAAAEYFFNVARNRTNPELLAGALSGIRGIVSAPHDEDLLERHLFVESELGRFGPELDAFVAFTKGFEDLHAHHIEWAERHFAKIDGSSPLRAKTWYVLGVQRLRRGSKPEAVDYLRRALEHPAAGRELRNQARLALARILFEDRLFAGALDLYERVEVAELSGAEPTLHLEKAWTHYHLGRLEESAGALHALNAPIYRKFHAPEIFLLRALIYRDLCQYVQSKRVIRTFRRRFGDTLRVIHERSELENEPVLRAAALQRGRLARLAAFAGELEKEQAALPAIAGDTALRAHLEKVHALAARKLELQTAALFQEQISEVAEELIDFEEQMQLLDYEVGLAINERIRIPAGDRIAGDAEAEVHAAEGAHFEFGGEFWNDELDNYRFVLPDRCVRKGRAAE